MFLHFVLLALFCSFAFLCASGNDIDNHVHTFLSGSFIALSQSSTLPQAMMATMSLRIVNCW